MVTKYRRPVLTPALRTEVFALARERATQWSGEVLEANGESDHIHLLLALPPHRAVADFVNVLKTNTSRLLRKKHPEHFARFYREPVLWSLSYCILSVGGASLDVLKQYIEQQDTS